MTYESAFIVNFFSKYFNDRSGQWFSPTGRLQPVIWDWPSVKLSLLSQSAGFSFENFENWLALRNRVNHEGARHRRKPLGRRSMGFEISTVIIIYIHSSQCWVPLTFKKNIRNLAFKLILLHSKAYLLSQSLLILYIIK